MSWTLDQTRRTHDKLDPKLVGQLVPEEQRQTEEVFFGCRVKMRNEVSFDFCGPASSTVSLTDGLESRPKLPQLQNPLFVF